MEIMQSKVVKFRRKDQRTYIIFHLLRPLMAVIPQVTAALKPGDELRSITCAIIVTEIISLSPSEFRTVSHPITKEILNIMFFFPKVAAIS